MCGELSSHTMSPIIKCFVPGWPLERINSVHSKNLKYDVLEITCQCTFKWNLSWQFSTISADESAITVLLTRISRFPGQLFNFFRTVFFISCYFWSLLTPSKFSGAEKIRRNPARDGEKDRPHRSRIG